MRVGETITNLRFQLRLSQKEFANLLGLKSQSLVSEYEKGIKTPSLLIAKKIVDIAKKHKIKITLDSIFSDDT